MVKHMKRNNENKVNLMDSTFSDIPLPKEKVNNTEEEDYAIFWKPSIYVNLVYDTSKYKRDGQMPAEVASNLKIDWINYAYEPIIYLSDFWVLKKDMPILNDTLESLNLTLNF
jgi:hypothetical protein